MKKLLLIVVYVLIAVIMGYGQDSLGLLNFSGSVDVYYKYDLSGWESEDGQGNIPTSFAGNHNSVSIGMANLIVSREGKKVGFVADVAFGPRGQEQSLLSAEDGNSFHIQNLYIDYSPVENLTFTAGFMGTFIGYEVISPVSNFHYSTSYLFSGGPFQNGGVKAEYRPGEKLSVMIGLFNDWNHYQDGNGMTDIGGQISLQVVEGYDMVLNFLKSDLSGTTIDFVSSMNFSSDWTAGVNFAHHRKGEVVSDYTGAALYQTWSISRSLELGLRGEWFKYYNRVGEGIPDDVQGPQLWSVTLSGNIHVGPVTFIPEWRSDFADTEIFFKRPGKVVKSASQFLLAAVYAFGN